MYMFSVQLALIQRQMILMSDKSSKIFGIDLGTTYSSIAYVDDYGKAVVINNSDNIPVTPSVVFFDGDDIVVGEVAKESSKLYPSEVVSFIKRAMGEADYFFEYDSKTYRAEEISSYIIKKVVQDAENTVGEKISDLVITCPAYFGINEREATRKAGEIAGYTVRQIINEPTAAAIAYGLAESHDERVVLVYDLGGGTFDITLIEIKPESISVICTGGDHNLGGKDWDDRIVAYLAQEFQDKTGSKEDILEDPDTCQDLLLIAEKSKKILTQRQKTPVAITHGGEKIKIEFEREKFEEITTALTERTIAFTKEMLIEASNKGYSDFDEIILVGGATRMPQITSRVEQEFNMKPKVFDPDGAVAKGAAIYGWKLSINDDLIRRVEKKTGKSIDQTKEGVGLVSLNGEVSEEIVSETAKEMSEELGYAMPAIEGSMVKISDVTSKSFGIVVKNVKLEEHVFNLILKNTAVPVKATKDFYTAVDNQDTVLIRIMENDTNEQTAPLDDSENIGTAVFTLPQGLPKDSKILIYFDMNSEGRLQITAEEMTDSRTVEVTIETKSVIQGEELQIAKERSQSLIVH